MEKFKEFISYFNSPFVTPKIKIYLGKVTIGTPYFTPRKVIKDPSKPTGLKFVPKKIGFDICCLGWKTKWSNTDFRFEWSPLISFVFFKWQIALIISVPDEQHYWESWLYYNKITDKTKSVLERVKECQKDYPQNWEKSTNGVTVKVNYYESILKKRYRPVKLNELRDKKLRSILK